jgi:D-glycero-beta-D-manno-heptose-7-phosphate kinase
MNDTNERGILKCFPGQRVLLVGDLMLDEYVWGSVRRISPEAPVPVVEVQRRSHVLGGAANAAANAAGLGATVHLAGIVGSDDAGVRLRSHLALQGIRGEGVLITEGRSTTTKTRIIALSQQVVRIDHEASLRCPAAVEEKLLEYIDGCLPRIDACIVSDYGKGVVSCTLARRVIDRANSRGKPVVVDPKKADPARYRGATLVKPNLYEATVFLRQEMTTPEDIAAAGPRLLELFDTSGVLLTRGAEGMSLFQRGRDPVHIPAQAREVFDVTGAGDTVAATVAVALAAGANAEQAARLASRAAGVIVGRLGTCAIRLEELQEIS